MKVFLLIIATILSFTVTAQFYYNDIVANTQSNQQYKLIKQQKVKKIKAVNYNPMGEIAEGFSIQQEVSLDGRKIITITVLPNNGTSTLTTSYESSKVKKTVDFSHGVETTTSYIYNDKGLLVSIASATNDTAVNAGMNEVHIWLYNANNQPAAMQKIKNKSDTTFIDFMYDEKGNIAEERWKRKGRVTETYYYYYNDKNQVTDIVKFNTRARQLLPETLYEYDAENRISQMTQSSNGGSNYFVWNYTYNDKGLKQKEVCYDKTKKFIGRIEYSYEW